MPNIGTTVPDERYKIPRLGIRFEYNIYEDSNMCYVGVVNSDNLADMEDAVDKEGIKIIIKSS